MGSYSNNEQLGKNKIINGNFNVWQRGTSGFAGGYNADRFTIDLCSASTATFTITRDATLPLLDNTNYALKVLVATLPGTPLASNDYVRVRHKVEGYNFLPLKGKTMTLSFWVRGNKTGVYSIAFENSANNRNFTTKYSINAVDTWEKKIITLTHDTTGTWDYINGVGLDIEWGLIVGGSNQTANVNKWEATGAFGVGDATNFLSSTNNYWQIAQVQLEEGSVATDFEHVDFSTEISKCQRYYCKSYDIDVNPGTGSIQGYIGGIGVNTSVFFVFDSGFPVKMRSTTPTVVIYSFNGTINKASLSNGVDVGTTVTGTAGRTGSRINTVADSGTGFVASTLYVFHYTAEAEL